MIARIKRFILTYGGGFGLACILYSLNDVLSDTAFLILTGTLTVLWCWAYDAMG